MKTARLSSKAMKAFGRGSPGFTLIEVLVALGLFAIIGIVFAGGLATASRAVITADVRTNAESLARTQMEYIKQQDYKDENQLVDGEALYLKIASADIPDGYEICSISRDGTIVNCSNGDHVVGVPWDSAAGERLEPLGTDDGLQKITLVIKHEGRKVLTLEGYKVYR
jgi:prepilin-type N-terminal cleavage/methylation domain-containing protein